MSDNKKVVHKQTAKITKKSDKKPVEVAIKTDKYVITHYIIAREDDPVYKNDKKVEAKGLTGKYRENFLYGNRGVLFQGTGLTEGGDYITIDWNKGGPKGKNTTFTKGKGGSWKKPEAWVNVAADPKIFKPGTKIKIAIYPDKIFTVCDTGGDIKGKHIDVFIGPGTLAEGNELGRKLSAVTIIK